MSSAQRHRISPCFISENKGFANDCQLCELHLDYVQFGCGVQLEELAVTMSRQQIGLKLDSGVGLRLGSKIQETTGVNLPQLLILQLIYLFHPAVLYIGPSSALCSLVFERQGLSEGLSFYIFRQALTLSSLPLSPHL